MLPAIQWHSGEVGEVGKVGGTVAASPQILHAGKEFTAVIIVAIEIPADFTCCGTGYVRMQPHMVKARCLNRCVFQY